MSLRIQPHVFTIEYASNKILAEKGQGRRCGSTIKSSEELTEHIDFVWKVKLLAYDAFLVSLMFRKY